MIGTILYWILATFVVLVSLIVVWELIQDAIDGKTHIVLFGTPIIADEDKAAVYCEILQNYTGRKIGVVRNLITGERRPFLEWLSLIGARYRVWSCCWNTLALVTLDLTNVDLVEANLWATKDKNAKVEEHIHSA